MQHPRIRHPEIGGILHLEHVNFPVADHDLATAFFMAGLGFTRDPHTRVDETNMAVNVGLQQFHLPRRKEGTPRIQALIGLITPELDAVKARCDALEREGVFAGTPYRYAAGADFHDVVSPFGVRMRMHPVGKLPFPQVLGLPYVELPVPPGSAAGIGRFYETVMQAPVAFEDGGRILCVTAGPYQWLRFVETAGLADYGNGPFHAAYYVSRYNAVFDTLSARGARISAGRDQVFFFEDILDPATGKAAFAFGNEVRSVYHFDFMRPLVNRWPMSDELPYYQRDPERENKRRAGFMPGI